MAAETYCKSLYESFMSKDSWYDLRSGKEIQSTTFENIIYKQKNPISKIRRNETFQKIVFNLGGFEIPIKVFCSLAIN
jgi:hypothetical protein